jgi:hypothetical protein
MGYDARGKYGKINTKFDTRDIYEDLEKGNPVLVCYRYKNHKRWVTVIGVKSGAQLNNLKPKDLVVLDPADGKKKRLTKCLGFSEKKIVGYKKVK